jgi:hypothetical protein
VGIGTTTPNQFLTIFNDADDAALEFSSAPDNTYKWTIGMDYDDAGMFKISSSTMLGTNDILKINGNGSVILGDFTGTAASSIYPLVVERQDSTGNSLLDVIRVRRSTSGSVSDGIGAAIWLGAERGDGAVVNGARIGAQIYNTAGIQDTSELVFYTNNDNSFAERMRIDEIGRVGIAIGNPTPPAGFPGYELHLYENDNNQTAIYVENPAGQTALTLDKGASNKGAYVNFKQDNSLHWVIGTPDTDNISGIVGNEFFIGTDANTPEIFIQTDGDVGFGDNSPDAHVEISAEGTTGGKVFLVSSDDNNDGDILTIEESGRVGIGTSSPESLFHVARSSATTTITVGSAGAGSGNGACLKLRDTDDGGWTYCYALDGSLVCGTASCE